MSEIKLTQYSHGAGCGCKIAPNILEQILHTDTVLLDNKNLLVGNLSNDDAAVYDMGNGQALISTTDFFMPIVDDPYNFGRIASANAISDVYAMGGKPILAIAILGWPINKLSPEIAKVVIDGARSMCAEAGIALAGGHSIDTVEPIFGLAVNGLIDKKNIKQNNTAKVGDVLLMTKSLGVGIITTAEKKGLVSEELKRFAANQMMKLNKIGEKLGTVSGVTAMTDITGFGLLGHLKEISEGSGLSAVIEFSKVPVISTEIFTLIREGAVPGGTGRNLNSYQEKIEVTKDLNERDTLQILADPQTSGGLLIAVTKDSLKEVQDLFCSHDLENYIHPIGYLTKKQKKLISII